MSKTNHHDEQRSLLRRTTWVTWAILAFLAFAIFALPVSMVNHVGFVRPDYKNEVGSYYDAAANAQTPELFKQNIQRAKSGLIATGLKSGDCSGHMPWNKVYTKCYDYVIAQLDALLARADDVIRWRDSRDRQIAEGGDGYGEKMRNLRVSVEEVRDVSYYMWKLHEHPVISYTDNIWPLVLIGGFFGTMARGIYIDYHHDTGFFGIRKRYR